MSTMIEYDANLKACDIQLVESLSPSFSYLAAEPLQAININFYQKVARWLLHARLHRRWLSVDTPRV
jgi:hypothetical protein